MTYFLAIQNTYHELQIALFQEEKILETVSTDKKTASRDVILLLENLLIKNHLSFLQIQFIVANQGPGPFTTLRVVIATVNGLSFASHIPLVGVNALEALLAEYPSDYQTIALMNAFSNDVYYAVRIAAGNITQQGCTSITQLISELAEISAPVNFLGNGATMHQENIKKMLGARALFVNPMPEMCSITQIALLGLQQWKNKQNISHQLQPIYLKQASY